MALLGCRGFVSRFVISADRRYPALAARYQGGGAHVPYRETGRHVVYRGYYTISHYGGQTLNKRGRSCAICPCFCYTRRGADLEYGYPRHYRWPLANDTAGFAVRNLDEVTKGSHINMYRWN